MSNAIQTEPYQVIWLVRRLFRALSQKSNESLEGFGISAADRAVMEFLYPDRKLSVPEIAERYSVSRQHIQVTVNTLLESELVATEANPRHKRSPLIKLSRAGLELFTAVLKQDEKAVEQLFSNLSEGDVRITRATLQSLLDELSRG